MGGWKEIGTHGSEGISKEGGMKGALDKPPRDGHIPFHLLAPWCYLGRGKGRGKFW